MVIPFEASSPLQTFSYNPGGFPNKLLLRQVAPRTSLIRAVWELPIRLSLATLKVVVRVLELDVRRTSNNALIVPRPVLTKTLLDVCVLAGRFLIGLGYSQKGSGSHQWFLHPPWCSHRFPGSERGSQTVPRQLPKRAPEPSRKVPRLYNTGYSLHVSSAKL